ncbi:hypothetical protein LOZ61_005578 [Ophidiomyces ophidiicola]|nr:hypothetical protein LOZ61_005578 [Ophidiomyces ophidiicola]KAI1924272.1 hypothetical protein LOZ60_004820 [Ophidiomyces ophidiicola]KAI1953365.1 hypothetical protein LOZ59_005150 [Ophidiomyces ophidiicola]KAI2020040.1 hypothetical protein LOZ45_005294 [Ophidiomyces ophidiicola]KAI2034882.1 hypothetical protein LOZ48_001533 [Ophidiomyces ophidiicola]
MDRLPDINALPSLSASTRNQVVDLLFEPSAHIHSLVSLILEQNEFTSYPTLINAIQERLTAIASSTAAEDRTVLLDILGSHPRLGPKPSSPKAAKDGTCPRGDHLSEMSRAEQANLNKAGQQGTAEQLSALNHEYEQHFPGLRYVTFVNGRARDVIMEDIRRRIDRGDSELEILETIQEAKFFFECIPTAIADFRQLYKMPMEQYARLGNGMTVPGAAPDPVTSQSSTNGLGERDEKHWGNGYEGQLISSFGSERDDFDSLESFAQDSPANGNLAHGGLQQLAPKDPTDALSRDNSAPTPPPLTRNSTVKPSSVTLLQQKHSSSTSIPLLASQSHTPIDPLSQQILHRTNTEKTFSSKLRPQTSLDVESVPLEAGRSPVFEDPSLAVRADSHSLQRPTKDKKKGVSFLSRIIGNKKKDDHSETNDDVSELGEHRAAGMDAEIFAQLIGYIPRFPPPPKYIRVRAHHKKTKDFNKLFVAQELKANDAQDTSSENKDTTINVFESDAAAQEGKAVWVTEFSKDGKYLAVAGQDRKVRVWAVIATAEDRQSHEIEEEAQADQPSMRLSAPVFKTQPLRQYEGHTGSIVDVSWSKNNFLLTSSLDKTVRLWHVTRNECLCCFKHNDVVTSIEFHPKDDRFFLAGSLDSKMRLWSIPDKNVAFWAAAPDLITAVAFTPDGKNTITGCLNGQCIIYETDGLKMVSQIHVRSARGRNAKGSKITGIDTLMYPPGQESGGVVKILITSNDSRIRLYNLRDKTMEVKFRGNENSASQIRASFSSDGRYIVCGSEDRRVYIWPVEGNERFGDKRPLESFEAHSSMVTTAIIAPEKTKEILGSTGDLLYDLCNPPPITLVSQTPSVASRSANDVGAKEPPSPAARPPASEPQKPAESPAYRARMSHRAGNIIVTADYNGIIKVFRQDCGYQRRQYETWETSSLFSKKLLGRNNSVSTRRSAMSIGKDSVHKTPSERILSWRNSVIGSRDNASVDNFRATEGSSIRSVSPISSVRKSSSTPKVDSNPPMRLPGRLAHISSPMSRTKPPTPPHPFSGTIIPESSASTSRGDMDASKNNNNYNNTQPKGGEFEDDPLFLEGNRSFMFWNKSRFASQAANRRRSLVESREDVPPLGSLTSDESADDDRDTSGSLNEDDEEELTCPRCHGTNFKATRMKTGEQRLKCVQCGGFAS